MMYTGVFRSFYLIFAGMFLMVLLALALLLLHAVLFGDPGSALACLFLGGLAFVLVSRSVRYMRELRG